MLRPGQRLRLAVEVPHDRQLRLELEVQGVSLEMTLNTFLKNIGRAKKLLTDCLAHQGIAVEKL